MDKRTLSERDICTKFVTPAIAQAGWKQSQFREEVKLTAGRVVVRGKLASRIINRNAKGGPKRADYVIYARPNVPIAVVEAKRNQYPVGQGMQQALLYAEMLDAPFALSSNGDGFLFHDRTGLTQPTERELGLDAFPKYSDLWPVYRKWKGLDEESAGRGTRIREDYHKLYFTVMDFKNATRLFADPDFDGEPVVVYEPGPDDPVVPPEDDTQPGGEGPDLVPGPHVDYGDPDGFVGGEVTDRPSRYVVDDVTVRQGFWREQYLNADGKLITEDYRMFLKEEIRKTLQGQFGTLKDFLNRWNAAERKQAIIDELKEWGIDLDVLTQAVPHAETLDLFDLVAHIAFDQKPLTRKERANHVRKRNYFGKYGDQARQVLEALLEKYATNGIADIEDPKVLELPPFDRLGSKTQIRRGIFGGSENYSKALTELEQVIYEVMSA